MGARIGVGLLGLGTVGGGVASILLNPKERHPLVKDLELVRVAVRDLNRSRPVDLPEAVLTTDPGAVVNDPAVDVVVEVIGGIEPARTLILQAIAAGKSVVTANKAVIARHGTEIAAAAKAAGVYVLIEAAVGGGIPIIEPLKQSLGGNRIDRVSGIVNGTTNYILTRMAEEGAAYDAVLTDAQRLGYAEADPAADVDGLDAADKIAILSTLAFGGPIDRSAIPTEGISTLQGRDVDYARQLGYGVKLLAVAERLGGAGDDPLPLSLRVQPTLVPGSSLAGVNGVNNAILVEGDPIGRVMFYGPGAGAGPTASPLSPTFSTSPEFVRPVTPPVASIPCCWRQLAHLRSGGQRGHTPTPLCAFQHVGYPWCDRKRGGCFGACGCPFNPSCSSMPAKRR